MRELIIKNIKEIQDEIVKNINKHFEDSFYYQHKKLIVVNSKNNQVDFDYCKTHNIEVWQAFNEGGTIVANEGDISIAIFKQNGWQTGRNFLNHFKRFLETKIIKPIQVIGNDLIIQDKYKIASFASVNTGNAYIYTVIHITFNPNVETIRKVCTKDSLKIPKGLRDYYVSQNDIINAILNFNNEEGL